MKKNLAIICCFFIASMGLYADTIFMKAGSRTFELEVKETAGGKDFLKFVGGRSLKMQKYGGFEFYFNENLRTLNERTYSRCEKGNVYYNKASNTISFTYENHSLEKYSAVLIGTFKDRAVCDFLRSAGNNTVFVFTKQEK